MYVFFPLATPYSLTVASAGANLMGADLYGHLIRYFSTHLKILREVTSHLTSLTRSIQSRGS